MEKCELVEAKPISLELSVSQFLRERSDNQDFFGARYKGKTLQITGKVLWPAGDGLGASTVVLDAGGYDPTGADFMSTTSSSNRVVIAGGSGFLGVSLAHHLSAAGMAVVLLSRYAPRRMR